jgi:predicted Holliday junction resolvase-like endonuclease
MRVGKEVEREREKAVREAIEKARVVLEKENEMK